MFVGLVNLCVVITAGMLHGCCGEVLTNDSHYFSSHHSEHFRESVRLLYGDSHGISWTDLAQDHRLPPLLTHPHKDVLGLDYHYARHALFYSSWENIWRLGMTENGTTGSAEVIVKRADGATSVAVDWVRDRVYWASPANHTVWRADLSGSHVRVVLESTGTLGKHSNIVLDPYSRFLFLALDGNSILRSDLDGGDRHNVQAKGYDTRGVVTLAVDTRRKRLYMSARQDYAASILACGYDGSAATEYQLTDEWWNSLVSIGVFRDQLFWVHQGWLERDTVWKANISDNSSLSWEKEYTTRGTLLDPASKIWVLKVYHPDVQTLGHEELKPTHDAMESQQTSRGYMTQIPTPGLSLVVFSATMCVSSILKHKQF